MRPHADSESTRALGRSVPPLLIAVVLCTAEWLVIGQAAISEYLSSFPQALGILLLLMAFGLNLWAASLISKQMR